MHRRSARRILPQFAECSSPVNICLFSADSCGKIISVVRNRTQKHTSCEGEHHHGSRQKLCCWHCKALYAHEPDPAHRDRPCRGRHSGNRGKRLDLPVHPGRPLCRRSQGDGADPGLCHRGSSPCPVEVPSRPPLWHRHLSVPSDYAGRSSALCLYKLRVPAEDRFADRRIRPAAPAGPWRGLL